MDSSILNDDNDQYSFSPKTFIEEDKINDFTDESPNKIDLEHQYVSINTLSNHSNSAEYMLNALEYEAPVKNKVKCLSSLLKIEEKPPKSRKQSSFKNSISSMSSEVRQATAKFEQIKEILSIKDKENQELKDIINHLENKLTTLENQSSYCGRCHIF